MSEGSGNLLPSGTGQSAGWIIAALSSAIAFLFKVLQGAQAKQLADVREQCNELRIRCDLSDKKHEQCQQDRLDLAKQATRLETEVNHLKQQIDKAG
jgi:chromosome segregation ATPase